MKKVLALGMAAALLTSSASAANNLFSLEGIKSKIPDQVVQATDYSKMTDEELQSIIDAATAELSARKAGQSVEKKNDALIYSKNGFTVRFAGWTYSTSYGDNDPYICIYMKFENATENDYSLLWTFGKSYVNNWEATVYSSGSVEAGRNSIEYICLQNLSEIGITSAEDIRDVDIGFEVYSDADCFSVSASFEDIHAYPMYKK